MIVELSRSISFEWFEKSMRVQTRDNLYEASQSNNC